MTNTETAIAFLRAARAGDRTAVEALVAADAIHHNPYFAAGMPTLLDAIMAAAREHPAGTLDVKHTAEQDDLVFVHSHVRNTPTHAGIAVVHILRLANGRITEFWDIGQPIPDPNPNQDGMF